MSTLPSRPVVAPELLECLLDQLALGVLLIDTACDVRYANSSARGMLDNRQGVALVGHRLVVQSGNPQRKLENLVRRVAARGGMAAMHVPGSQDGLAQTAVVMPLRDLLGQPLPHDAPPLFSVYLLGQLRPLPQMIQLAVDLYGLTPREQDVLQGVLQGTPLQALAGQMSVGYCTVRSHLLSVFRKTLSGTQGDLLRALMPLMAIGAGEAAPAV